ncbi:DUF1566 domain-containing protein [Salinimonas marina]|uniref:DUF1566 domain-containing protein n=1 Tax=Salinimonas marina TaxID=2785918 RepID=A0A7S9DW57_9ALTE|nr:DUF1566 domain-containing protein [Salinimonas marina]QPG05068.1 DUF1566 domain-containing protein [Salinimonas marina]
MKNSLSSSSVIRLRAVLLTLVLIFLSGCGGGDSSSDSDNISPVFAVNAGADAQANEQTVVFLSAQVSGTSDTLTYRWQSTPEMTIEQPDASLPEASVTLPELSSQQTYTVTVTVTNTQGKAVSDSLVITVLPVNEPPQVAITAPPANDEAGRYAAGIDITLDGSGSTDADTNTPASPISSWLWEQLEGVDVTSALALDGPTISFTTPVASTEQSLRFRLTVEDDEGSSSTQTIVMLIQPDTDTQPVVDAGPGQGVFSGEPIILKGTASSSVSSALPLHYQWEASNNQQLSILQPDALSTYAIAPNVTSAQSFSFTLNVTDANGNRVSDNIQVTVRPMPVTRLNDTGVTTQATATTLSKTQQNAFPGQDGQRGADIVAAQGWLEKAGRGVAGFDFTKLNSNGDEQDAAQSEFSCVRDNTTGLVWEVKTDDGGLYDGTHTYTWFQGENNGGNEGESGSPEASCAITECNSRSYIAAVRAQGLCGFYDWRLPNHFELMSLVHFGQTNTAMLDTDYFPNTGDIADAPLWYWTSQPGADGVVSDAAQNAWAIDFGSGVDNFLDKGSVAHIRLVRAGRAQ